MITKNKMKALVLLFVALVSVKADDVSKRLDALEKRTTKLERNSKTCMLFPNPCGGCKCIDDFRQAGKHYCDCTAFKPQHDCRDWFDLGYQQSGLYRLKLDKTEFIQVWCDMESKPGGWTVFQRRMNGQENFYRSWSEYKHGFGDLTGEHWLGNEKVHKMTQGRPGESFDLEIMVDHQTNKHPQQFRWNSFYLGGEGSHYTLHVSGYHAFNANCPSTQADRCDGLKWHNGKRFATYDNSQPYNCAKQFYSGWWYGDCYKTNLNGRYWKFGTPDQKTNGVTYMWETFPSKSNTFAEMKFRRRNN